MNLKEFNWKFDSSVVPVFDEHISTSIPLYEEIHLHITDIASWFLQDGTNMYDIGTSTGKVIKNLMNKYKKDVEYIGIDNSVDMCNALRDEDLNITIMNEDVVKDTCFVNASFITSIFTIQFIPKKFRQALLAKIYEGLNEGGAFIFVEKVTASNGKFNEIWTDLLYESKLRKGISEKQIIDKAKSIRGILTPHTMEENMRLLSEAGFKEIDIFFKWSNFVGFIAIK